MRFLAQALDPLQAQERLVECCPGWVKRLGRAEVRSVRVVRYKPERRCLIEYELDAPEVAARPIVILGKVRAKGLDARTFELLQTLWRGNFGPQSDDGIYVPEPIGVIAPFQMWLQAKAPGVESTELLA